MQSMRSLQELPSPPKKKKIEVSKCDTNQFDVLDQIVDSFSPLKKMSFTN